MSMWIRYLSIVLSALIGINLGLFWVQCRTIRESASRLAEIKELQNAVEANVEELRVLLGILKT